MRMTRSAGVLVDDVVEDVDDNVDDMNKGS